MANVVNKILGQVSPSAGTYANLYVTPGNATAVGSSLIVCNTGNVMATVNVAIRQFGANLADQHFVLCNAVVNPQDATFIAAGITTGNTDIISVSASRANVSFNLFGMEITQ